MAEFDLRPASTIPSSDIVKGEANSPQTPFAAVKNKKQEDSAHLNKLKADYNQHTYQSDLCVPPHPKSLLRPWG